MTSSSGCDQYRLPTAAPDDTASSSVRRPEIPLAGASAAGPAGGVDTEVILPLTAWGPSCRVETSHAWVHGRLPGREPVLHVHQPGPVPSADPPGARGPDVHRDRHR